MTERKTLQLRDPSEGADAAPVLKKKGRGWEISEKRLDKIVAATTRTSTNFVSLEPTGRTSPLSSTRRSLACIARGMSPISSRNRVPPSAASNRS